MTVAPLLIILASVLLTAGAQLALKVTSGRFSAPTGSDGLLNSVIGQLLDPLTILALALYVGSTILWLLALRQVPLSMAFPFSGLTIAIVSVLSIIVLGESISWQHAVGILMIMIGVAMLAHSGGA
ncbi:MAG: EamA family transporter [Burkholderiaceae bacterium]